MTVCPRSSLSTRVSPVPGQSSGSVTPLDEKYWRTCFHVPSFRNWSRSYGGSSHGLGADQYAALTLTLTVVSLIALMSDEYTDSQYDWIPCTQPP